MRSSRRVDTWLVTTGAVILGGACCWRLWEQDVWWQIRAGHDLVATLRLPAGEEWSYTSRGKPWENIQWLATVVLWAVHAIGGVTGLIVLRGLLAAALALFIGRTAWRISGKATVALALIVVAWLACAYRIQVRPDTFVLVVFAALVDLWTSNATPHRKRTVTFGLIVLAANLHAGTAPAVAGVAVALLAASWRSVRSEIGWLVAFPLACLFTPYHVEFVPILWRHLFVGDYSIPNPDIRPLSWERFQVARFGFTATAWAVLVVLALVVRSMPQGFAPRTPSPWRRGPWSMAALVGLTVMSIRHDRIVPYSAIFAVPLVAALLAGRGRRAVGAIASICWLLVPLQLWVFPARWGFGEDARIDPVFAVAWIHENAPQPNILHLAGEGNYLLGHAPEYPVFIDTREAPYRALEDTYAKMVDQPEVMQAVIERWGIQTVLLPMSWFRVPYQGQWRRAVFLPKKSWALVHFDARWVVLVHRTDANGPLIEKFEYHFLVPYLPTDSFAKRVDGTAESAQRLRDEVERCLGVWPDSPLCNAARASFATRPE